MAASLGMHGRPGMRVLLLDLDEVVFRHPAAHAVVARRVVGLLADRLRLSHGDADTLNRRLYGGHGHTLIGLQNELDVTVSVDDFNAAVYARETLAEVARLPHHPHTRQRASEAARLLIAMRRREVQCYVFSNAPRIWCEFALGMVGLGGVFPPDRLLTSDGHDPLDLVLKPSTLSYACVEGLVRSPPAGIAFVDDSPRNLASAPDAWDKYLMCNAEGAGAGLDACPRACPLARLDDLA